VAIQWIKKGIWLKALLDKGAGLLRVARKDSGGCAGLLDWLDCRVAALLAMTVAAAPGVGLAGLPCCCAPRNDGAARGQRPWRSRCFKKARHRERSAAIQWIKKGIWPKALLNKGAGLLRVARNDIGGCAGLLDWLDCRVAALLAMTGGCLCERSVAIKVFAVMNGLAAVNIPVRWRSGLLVLYARSYFI